jgi:hypothetical protein
MIRRIAVVTAGLALVATAGCVRVELPEGEYESTTEQVDIADATEIDASVDMAAGKLEVTGGAVGALDADFDFSRSAWRPEVEYGVAGGIGRLSVRTPQVPDFSMRGDLRYDWDLQLPSDVPLELSVNMGAGQADLDLTGTMLREIRVNLGAGDTTVDLSGAWDDDITGEINAGAGSLTLKVPADVGVRIVGYQDGLGSYRANGFEQDGDALVNDAYETADVRFDLVLRRGLGDVTIETIE